MKESIQGPGQSPPLAVDAEFCFKVVLNPGSFGIGGLAFMFAEKGSVLEEFRGLAVLDERIEGLFADLYYIDEVVDV